MPRKPILDDVSAPVGDAPLFFYELHESDTDLYANLLLAHETEFDEAEFLELVLDARARLIDTFTADSLIEAVAADLAERNGFLVIDDSRLRVSVNLSVEDKGTFVADVEELSRIGGRGDFRTLVVDVEPDDAAWGVADGSRVRDDRFDD